MKRIEGLHITETGLPMAAGFKDTNGGSETTMPFAKISAAASRNQAFGKPMLYAMLFVVGDCTKPEK